MQLHTSFKIGAFLLVMYASVAGILMPVPALDILNESIRNLFFHVTAWFAMVFLFLVSAYFSVKMLRSGSLQHDSAAAACAHVGLIFGLAGLLTGMVWARFTWGAFWVNDPKLNGAAMALLAYFAYIVLRIGIQNPALKARLSAVYNLFALCMMLLFVFVLPRLTDSLHPGNGGNPAFSNYDLDQNMRLVFYPAVVGWSLVGLWMASLRHRLNLLHL